VGTTWQDLFHPGTPSTLSLDARVRVVADVAGALIHIHDNPGLPRPHRRHGRLTPRHLLVGVDGSASLFTAREPFSKLLPPQPDLGYLAPELLTQSGPATAQSDVFSLGVLLWEALDNGRLFPHRRAAAISRLIARRSLPGPRIEEEWALPLGDVAMKALSQDPADRHADAKAFWLALREHLPAPDAARGVLSRLAQRALKLELTTDIRDNPPFVGAVSPLSRSQAPEVDAPTEDAPARYSLRPEPSTRQTGLSIPVPRSEDPAWALSDVPPRPSELDLEPVVRESEPAPARPQARSAPRSEALAAMVRPSSAPAPRAVAVPASVRPEADGPVSTLHVNLPRELIDASLPFYAPATSAPRPFPWGALSFAALIFFGVGAAVAFGAVTALRGPAASERLAPAVPQAAVVAAPAPQAPPPSAAAPAVSAAPSAVAPTPSEPTPPAPAITPSATPAAASGTVTPSADTAAAVAPAPAGAAAAPVERATTTPRKAAKRAKAAKTRRPKHESAPPSQGNTAETPVGTAHADLEEEPWSDPAPEGSNPTPATELPFVDQPY
jgi:hypothetical protein